MPIVGVKMSAKKLSDFVKTCSVSLPPTSLKSADNHKFHGNMQSLAFFLKTTETTKTSYSVMNFGSLQLQQRLQDWRCNLSRISYSTYETVEMIQVLIKSQLYIFFIASHLHSSIICNGHSRHVL